MLDGRHRLRACVELGREPIFKTYEGEDPAAYVVAQSLARRNLTSTQRAMIGARLLPAQEAEAKKRQGRRTSPPPGGQVAVRTAALDAGRITCVSARSIERAKRVLRNPAIADQVQRGMITLGAAERKVVARKVVARQSQSPARPKQTPKRAQRRSGGTPAPPHPGMAELERRVDALEQACEDLTLPLKSARGQIASLARRVQAIVVELERVEKVLG